MYSFDANKAANECVEWIKDWFDKYGHGKGCNAVIGISGGKDSSVVAGLCAKALGPERVIGVMLPCTGYDDEQPDIEDSKAIIKHLGIHRAEFNIYDTVDEILMASKSLSDLAVKLKMPIWSQQTRENVQPRIRMSALYAIAQSFNGRVSNNCNLSETIIGYSTIYGDTAGDFAPIADFTVSEVIEVGRAIGIPEQFLVKPPSDGLCGKTDEEKIGFSYAVLDKYLRTGEIDDEKVKNRIHSMYVKNMFKHKPMKKFDWGKVVAFD